MIGKNLESKRMEMVESQIYARGVEDRSILKAMRKVPRHVFVPSDYSESAYADRPLPIGHGQTISQPYMVAVMTEALRLKGQEKVLEVGTGSGYQAAILAEIVGHVVTLERSSTNLSRTEIGSTTRESVFGRILAAPLETWR